MPLRAGAYARNEMNTPFTFEMPVTHTFVEDGAESRKTLKWRGCVYDRYVFMHAPDAPEIPGVRVEITGDTFMRAALVSRSQIFAVLSRIKWLVRDDLYEQQSLELERNE